MKNDKNNLLRSVPLTVQNATVTQKKYQEYTTRLISIKKYQSTQNTNDIFYRPISKL